MSIYGHYTDGEPIGMDHPLFMARMQAGIDAGRSAAQGLSLEEALRNIRVRMRGLFGDIPLALVDATVSMTYARYAADKPETNPPAVD